MFCGVQFININVCANSYFNFHIKKKKVLENFMIYDYYFFFLGSGEGRAGGRDGDPSDSEIKISFLKDSST